MIHNLSAKLQRYGVTDCVIAVSGGVDSMALSYLLSQIQDVKFKAVIVDHNLRDSSYAEALEAKRNLEKLGISTDIITLESGNEINSNIEARAREGRYKILSDYAKANSHQAVLLAHHQDDVTENFFIRLTRGSGIDGLAKMQEDVEINGVRFLRPLLGMRKHDLRKILEDNNVSWVEDPSNQSEDFLRNKVRRVLKELLPDDISQKRILQTSEHCRRAQDYLQDQVIKTFNDLAVLDGNKISVLHADFQSLHEEIGLRLLVYIFSELTGAEYKPRFVKLQEVYNNLHSLNFNRQLTFANCLIKQKKLNKESHLIFSKEH